MILIARHINGICLNDREYVLDGPEGEPMEFDDTEKAKEFILEAGATQKDLDDGYIFFVDAETNEVI
jgi:hypothetical protein